MVALEQSREEFLERCRELGAEHAGPWLEDCEDYGDLTKVASGHPITEIPEYIWDEVTRKEFVEDFGGVPDQGAFLEEFNQELNNLRERANSIIADLQQP